MRPQIGGPHATVLIPTHDHGRLIRHAVRSALSQTVEEIEVLIVGDGASPETREAATALGEHERVRFFDNAKGPRHGEVHRHAALADARGEIVCYLSDDDLWMPSHIESMLQLLSEADFASSPTMRFRARGEADLLLADLGSPRDREMLLSGRNRVPLSGGAHTLAFYRRLPFGWRTTPEGTPTDLYMWQQLLEDPTCRAHSAKRPSVLNFPAPERRGWTLSERGEELEEYAAKANNPAWRAQTELDLLADEVHVQAHQLADEADLRRSAEKTVRQQERTIEGLRLEGRGLRLGLREIKRGRAYRAARAASRLAWFLRRGSRGPAAGLRGEAAARTSDGTGEPETSDARPQR